MSIQTFSDLIILSLSSQQNCCPDQCWYDASGPLICPLIVGNWHYPDLFIVTAKIHRLFN